MSKASIKNREGEKIVFDLDIARPQKGLAFIMPGLGGFKEQPHIQVMAEVFKARDFTVLLIDPLNSFGESSGDYRDSTVDTHYETLVSVIEWAKNQPWYQEPFALAGHSLGAMAVALYAENNQGEVAALAPISVVVSGKLSMQAHEKFKKEEMVKWQETGWLTKPSKSKPGIIKKLPWSHMENRLKYNLLLGADKLTMPLLLVVGSEDISTPSEHQKIFFANIPGEKKQLHIIKGSPHTFVKDEHLEELKDIFNKWIKTWS